MAWSRDTSGRFWTLELDAAERAADSGARWTASTLAATWRADPAASAALRWAGVTSLVPLDDRRLVAELASPSLEVPRLFADRALGRAADGGRQRSARSHRPPAISATPSTRAPTWSDAPTRRCSTTPAGGPGVTAVALPWSRTYCCCCRPGAPGVGAAIPADTAGFQAGLARDAVRADARPAEGPFWWDARAACRGAPRPRRVARRPTRSPTPPRIPSRATSRSGSWRSRAGT